MKIPSGEKSDPEMNVPIFAENERKLRTFQIVLESLVESKSFGERLQELCIELTGEAIPEMKVFYDPATGEESYRIRMNRSEYAHFLESY